MALIWTDWTLCGGLLLSFRLFIGEGAGVRLVEELNIIKYKVAFGSSRIWSALVDGSCH